MRKKRAPSLRELLATLQAEADTHGASVRKVLDGGATIQYRSRAEGQKRRRQLIVTREGVEPGVIEMQTFAGHGYIPDSATEARYVRGSTHYATLTWEVPIIVMPQAELPL